MTSTATPALCATASSLTCPAPTRGLRTAAVLIALGLLTGAAQLAATPTVVGDQIVVVTSHGAHR